MLSASHMACSALFRAAGVVILVVLVASFSLSLHGYMSGASDACRTRIDRSVLVCLGICSGLVLYGRWILTPSYNWLNLCGLLLAGTGLLRLSLHIRSAEKPSLLSVASSVVYVGVGSGLSLVSKPPSFVLLMLVVIPWMVSVSRAWGALGFFPAAVAFFSCALVVLANPLTLQVGLAGVVSHLLTGAQIYVQLRDQGIADLVWQAGEDFQSLAVNILLSPAVAIVAAPIALRRLQRRWNLDDELVLRLSGLFSTACIVCFWAAFTARGHWLVLGSFGHWGLVFVVLYFLSWYVSNWTAGRRKRRDLGVVILLLVFAAAFGFGSGSGLFIKMSEGFVFLALAGFLLARNTDEVLDSRVCTLSAVLVFFVPAILILVQSYQNPYRLPTDIGDQSTDVVFFGNHGGLQVDAATHSYVAGLEKAAERSGWRVGNQLIDLTGATPGAAIILNARAVSTPWLLGGYQGSTRFAREMLSRARPDDLKSSWLLTAPDGKRRIHEKGLLEELGLRFPADFEVAGEVRTGWRNESQVLWKPRVPTRPNGS